MEVRDAVEADAGRLAELTDSPRDVMRNLVHDRTVRVAENDDEDIVGFISFDAREQTVHVTQLEGERDVSERLLEEPLRFAHNESMAVELLVPEDKTDIQTAVEGTGFKRSGTGPRFEGIPTIRYRLDAP